MVLEPPGAGIPLPRPTPLSEPHWEGARRGELMVQRCRACGGYVFIPQPVCTHCFEADLEWVRSSGRGTIYSYTTIHRPQQPAFDVPYVAAIVEVEEGWYLLTNVIGVEPSEVHVDMPVEVVFHRVSDEITLPYFRPVEGA